MLTEISEIFNKISQSFINKKKESCEIPKLLQVHNTLSRKIHTVSPQEKDSIRKHLSYIDNEIAFYAKEYNCRDMLHCTACSIDYFDWEITFNEEWQLILAQAVGRFDDSRIKAMFKDLAAFAGEHEFCPILCDHRALIPTISFSGLYYIPFFLKDLGFSVYTRIVSFYAPRYERSFQLLAEACKTLGYAVFCVPSLEKAVSIIQNKKPDAPV